MLRMINEKVELKKRSTIKIETQWKIGPASCLVYLEAAYSLIRAAGLTLPWLPQQSCQNTSAPGKGETSHWSQPGINSVSGCGAMHNKPQGWSCHCQGSTLRWFRTFDLQVGQTVMAPMSEDVLHQPTDPSRLPCNALLQLSCYPRLAWRNVRPSIQFSTFMVVFHGCSHKQSDLYFNSAYIFFLSSMLSPLATHSTPPHTVSQFFSPPSAARSSFVKKTSSLMM